MGTRMLVADVIDGYRYSESGGATRGQQIANLLAAAGLLRIQERPDVLHRLTPGEHFLFTDEMGTPAVYVVDDVIERAGGNVSIYGWKANERENSTLITDGPANLPVRKLVD